MLTINQNLKAAALILTASFMIVAMNMFAKLLTEAGLTPVEALFYRNIGGFFIITALIALTGKTESFKTKRLHGQIIRAFIGNICLGLVIWANALLPLATVSAILLLTPIIATAMAPIFLGEKTSWFRWVCIVLGLVGALVITRPGLTDFSFAYVIALLGAISSAGVLVSLRTLGKSEDFMTTTFYFLGLGSLMTGIVLPFFWSHFPTNFALLAGLIVCGFLNQIFKTKAFTYSELSFLTPLKYFNIVWATLLGWAIWNEIPQIHVYIGCSIIIASNLLITWQENYTKNKN